MNCSFCKSTSLVVDRPYYYTLNREVDTIKCNSCGRELLCKLEKPRIEERPAKKIPVAVVTEIRKTDEQRRMEEFMKNSLKDLNTHLFSQLDRLSVADLQGEKLAEEVERAKAIGGLAGLIIAESRLVLDAHRTIGDGKTIPAMFDMKEITDESR